MPKWGELVPWTSCRPCSAITTFFCGGDILTTADDFTGMPFEGLIQEARNGSDVAAKIIVERYQPHILQVIRRKMHRDMRQKFDSQDFCQAVWVSFFRNRDQLLEATHPAQLIGYLAIMARNKLLDETRRRLHTKKHDIRRERQLASDVGQKCSASDSPSHVAMAREAWDRIMKVSSARDREIAILRMRGEQIGTIAKQVGVSERTVSRVLTRLENESGR